MQLPRRGSQYAHFDFELRGSKGGVFKDVVVRKTNQIWDPEFRFTVS